MSFYPKLAFDAIRKNRRLYLPYFFTCAGMVMMYYIILYLQGGRALDNVIGADTVRELLAFGGWIILLFACLFLFYTNSFLIRRRKKEFGLYNVLGMNKRNIAVVLFWESLMVAGAALVTGLAGGMTLSKLAELGLFRLMGAAADANLAFPSGAIAMTMLSFGVIFALLYLNTLRQIRFSSAIALLRSEKAGEKPPKGNWFFGLLGVVVLGVAYYLAVSIRNPIEALLIFFFAVGLVILGTYLVMIAGSVLLCRILQKNKRYYYKANHFVSVSSMAYRMRRNGAGLASVCILVTMVLVMISSTACLYFGSEHGLMERFPRQIDIDFQLQTIEDMSDENLAALTAEIDTVRKPYGVTPENAYDFRGAGIAGYLKDGVVEVDVAPLDDFELSTYSDVYQFFFVPLADYNRMTGAQQTLKNGEALLYLNRGKITDREISFRHGASFHIKGEIEDFPVGGDTSAQIIPTAVLVVPDLAWAVDGIDTLASFNGDRMLTLHWYMNFDTGLQPDEQIALCAALRENFAFSAFWERYGLTSAAFESLEAERADYYGVFGGIFYLGILLSIVFLFAAVLIIYYKQVSEGYEDQARFEIMQKVGMTKREIRRSINSQLLTVFYLPLIFAVLHLAFAFPIIRKLLLLFNLNNVWLFAATTGISIVVFALFYALVYRITSHAYYHIVSGAKPGVDP